MEYVLESGTRGRNALSWIHAEGQKDAEWQDNNRIVSLSFQNKRFFLPLQAADILAYELFKHLPNQLQGRVRPDRYPLRQLATINNEWHYTDDAELGNINEWLSRPRTENTL